MSIIQQLKALPYKDFVSKVYREVAVKRRGAYSQILWQALV